MTPMTPPNPISDITGKVIHCHQCGKQVHNPNNPRDSLPKEEYQKYLEYLDRLKLEPELLCCNCYNKLLSLSIRFVELAMTDTPLTVPQTFNVSVV